MEFGCSSPKYVLHLCWVRIGNTLYRRLSAWRVKRVWAELPPERRLIPAEPVHDVVAEIGQAQEADRDVPRWIRHMGPVGFRVNRLLTVWTAHNIQTLSGAGSSDSR